ncbi:MAG: phosphoribosyltransferase [Myxococcota bacterium]
MHPLRELHSSREVAERIDRLAERIFGDYRGRPIVCVIIEEGARVFAEKLLERLNGLGMQTERVFVRAHRTHGSSLLPIKLEPMDPALFHARDVLLLDDIADEGRTLAAILAQVRAGGPGSVRIAVLVSKHGRRRVDLEIAYSVFEVEKGWVVGFGMDLEGHYRELDHLAVIEGLD